MDSDETGKLDLLVTLCLREAVCFPVSEEPGLSLLENTVIMLAVAVSILLKTQPTACCLPHLLPVSPSLGSHPTLTKQELLAEEEMLIYQKNYKALLIKGKA